MVMVVLPTMRAVSNTSRSFQCIPQKGISARAGVVVEARDMMTACRLKVFEFMTSRNVDISAIHILYSPSLAQPKIFPAFFENLKIEV